MSSRFDWSHARWDDYEGSRLFENLCYDVISKMGFSSVDWRAGSRADEGRDIEATRITSDPIEGRRIEKWYIECKNYSHAISVSDIETKISWSDANRPTVFLIITNSFLSNPTKDWIKKVQNVKSYRITYMERARLEEEIQKYPEIHKRYFPSKFDIEIEKPYLHLLEEDVLHFEKGIELFNRSTKKDIIIEKLLFTSDNDGMNRLYAAEALEVLGHPLKRAEIITIIEALEKEHPGYIPIFIEKNKNNKYGKFLKRMIEIYKETKKNKTLKEKLNGWM